MESRRDDRALLRWIENGQRHHPPPRKTGSRRQLAYPDPEPGQGPLRADERRSRPAVLERTGRHLPLNDAVLRHLVMRRDGADDRTVPDREEQGTTRTSKAEKGERRRRDDDGDRVGTGDSDEPPNPPKPEESRTMSKFFRRRKFCSSPPRAEGDRLQAIPNTLRQNLTETARSSQPHHRHEVEVPAPARDRPSSAPASRP